MIFPNTNVAFPVVCTIYLCVHVRGFRKGHVLYIPDDHIGTPCCDKLSIWNLPHTGLITASWIVVDARC